MAICAACSTPGLDKLGNDYFTQGISIGRGLASSCLRRLRRPSQLMCTFLNSVPGPDILSRQTICHANLHRIKEKRPRFLRRPSLVIFTHKPRVEAHAYQPLLVLSAPTAP
ncbi:hypothetical protein HYQ44_019937 [Verticillium longisporum]|nr:hypothetical protein HYQ44_019937 [Verticillium longisporum]